MSEPKSECHGADVYFSKFDHVLDPKLRCEICNKPCTVRKEGE